MEHCEEIFELTDETRKTIICLANLYKIYRREWDLVRSFISIGSCCNSSVHISGFDHSTHDVLVIKIHEGDENFPSELVINFASVPQAVKSPFKFTMGVIHRIIFPCVQKPIVIFNTPICCLSYANINIDQFKSEFTSFLGMRPHVMEFEEFHAFCKALLLTFNKAVFTRTCCNLCYTKKKIKCQISNLNLHIFYQFLLYLFFRNINKIHVHASDVMLMYKKLHDHVRWNYFIQSFMFYSCGLPIKVIRREQFWLENCVKHASTPDLMGLSYTEAKTLDFINRLCSFGIKSEKKTQNNIKISDHNLSHVGTINLESEKSIDSDKIKNVSCNILPVETDSGNIAPCKILNESVSVLSNEIVEVSDNSNSSSEDEAQVAPAPNIAEVIGILYDTNSSAVVSSQYSASHYGYDDVYISDDCTSSVTEGVSESQNIKEYADEGSSDSGLIFNQIYNNLKHLFNSNHDNSLSPQEGETSREEKSSDERLQGSVDESRKKINHFRFFSSQEGVKASQSIDSKLSRVKDTINNGTKEISNFKYLHFSPGNEEVDEIDGFQFMSFESENEMNYYTRREKRQIILIKYHNIPKSSLPPHITKKLKNIQKLNITATNNKNNSRMDADLKILDDYLKSIKPHNIDDMFKEDRVVAKPVSLSSRKRGRRSSLGRPTTSGQKSRKPKSYRRVTSMSSDSEPNVLEPEGKDSNVISDTALTEEYVACLSHTEKTNEHKLVSSNKERPTKLGRKSSLKRPITSGQKGRKPGSHRPVASMSSDSEDRELNVSEPEGKDSNVISDSALTEEYVACLSHTEKTNEHKLVSCNKERPTKRGRKSSLKRPITSGQEGRKPGSHRRVASMSSDSEDRELNVSEPEGKDSNVISDSALTEEYVECSSSSEKLKEHKLVSSNDECPGKRGRKSSLERPTTSRQKGRKPESHRRVASMSSDSEDGKPNVLSKPEDKISNVISDSAVPEEYVECSSSSEKLNEHKLVSSNKEGPTKRGRKSSLRRVASSDAQNVEPNIVKQPEGKISSYLADLMRKMGIKPCFVKLERLPIPFDAFPQNGNATISLKDGNIPKDLGDKTQNISIRNESRLTVLNSHKIDNAIDSKNVPKDELKRFPMILPCNDVNGRHEACFDLEKHKNVNLGLVLNIGKNRPFSKEVSENLELLKQNSNVVDERWALIAASAVASTKATKAVVKRVLVPVISKPILEKALLQLKSLADNRSLAREVNEVVGDIVEYVANRDYFEKLTFEYDPDVPFNRSPIKPSHKKQEQSKVERELRKLINVTVINQCSNKSQSQVTGKCFKDFCVKGCICDSLNHSQCLSHCSKEKCMFTCICSNTENSEIQYPLMKSMNKLTKEKSSWHQTVIYKDNSIEFQGEIGKSKRTKKMPIRFHDDILYGPEILTFIEKPNHITRPDLHFPISKASKDSTKFEQPKEATKKSSMTLCKPETPENYSEPDQMNLGENNKIRASKDSAKFEQPNESTKKLLQKSSMTLCKPETPENDPEPDQINLGEYNKGKASKDSNKLSHKLKQPNEATKVPLLQKSQTNLCKPETPVNDSEPGQKNLGRDNKRKRPNKKDKINCKAKRAKKFEEEETHADEIEEETHSDDIEEESYSDALQEDMTWPDVYWLWCSIHSRYGCSCIAQLYFLKTTENCEITDSRFKLLKKEIPNLISSTPSLVYHLYNRSNHSARTFGAIIDYAKRNKSITFKKKRMYEVHNDIETFSNSLMKIKPMPIKLQLSRNNDEDFVDNEPPNSQGEKEEYGLWCWMAGFGYLPVTIGSNGIIVLKDPLALGLNHTFKDTYMASKWLNKFFKNHLLFENTKMYIRWDLVKGDFLKKLEPFDRNILITKSKIVSKYGHLVDKEEWNRQMLDINPVLAKRPAEDSPNPNRKKLQRCTRFDNGKEIQIDEEEEEEEEEDVPPILISDDEDQ